MEMYGATREDFARVKVKNAKHGLANEYARYKKEVSIDDVLTAPLVSDPLGLLDICATSDGGAAIVVSSMEYARRNGVSDPVRVRAISTVTPSYPQTVVELPNFATDSAAGIGGTPEHGFKESIAVRAYDEAGLGPDDLDCAEVYDLSTAMELDWYEQIGLCAPGEAERLVRDGDTMIGGRIPVNPSGGLACFGEAVPAQAIAQVCELTWQVQGRAAGRQVEGARVGFSINQGLFGHGSAVIVTS
jgi:acetyl-CoA acetyltransferase